MTELTKDEHKHIVKRFDGDLSSVLDSVLKMGDLVLDQLDRSLKALDDENIAAAKEIIERDQAVNELDMEIDEDLVRLIALRQPMGVDLRIVMTVAKTVADLERVGDQARKIATLTIRLFDSDGRTPNHKLLGDIYPMARHSADMLTRALQALKTLDVHEAVDVIRDDMKLEDEFLSSLRRLTTFIMEDSRHVGHAVEVVLGLRALERIGGHAKNIAGYVIYMVKGRDVRHLDLETLINDVVPSARRA